MSTRRTFRKLLAAGIITCPTAAVTQINHATAPALSFSPGIARLTIQNVGANNIEIGWSRGSAPTTGNMAVLAPLDSATFEMLEDDLQYLYVKATTADTKAYVWQEGP